MLNYFHGMHGLEDLEEIKILLILMFTDIYRLLVSKFLGERITNNARKILVVGTQGLEPRAGIVYKTSALTN